MSTFRLLTGDCRARLREIAPESVQCVVTSPPYWGLRDYGAAGQLGLEATSEEYVANMVEVFGDLRSALRKDGVLWLNLGDSYVAAPAGNKPGAHDSSGLTNPHRHEEVNPGRDAKRQPNRKPIPGLKSKDLVGIPWRVALALQAAGWWLRSDVIWHKPNPMPESVLDRPTRAHEYLFLLTKSERYFYDGAAIREPAVERAAGNSERKYRGDHGGVEGSRAHRGFSAPWSGESRNKRSVWTIPTHPFPEAHFATFPEELVLPCVLAGSRPGDTVLDPFSGAGTTGVVALKQGRSYVGVELNPAYVEMSRKQLAGVAPLLTKEVA